MNAVPYLYKTSDPKFSVFLSFLTTQFIQSSSTYHVSSLLFIFSSLRNECFYIQITLRSTPVRSLTMTMFSLFVCPSILMKEIKSPPSLLTVISTATRKTSSLWTTFKSSKSPLQEDCKRHWKSAVAVHLQAGLWLQCWNDDRFLLAWRQFNWCQNGLPTCYRI